MPRYSKGSRRAEVAPASGYDPHYSTGQDYSGYGDETGLADDFTQLNVHGQPPGDNSTYDPEYDVAHTGPSHAYDQYTYSTEHPADAGEYPYAGAGCTHDTAAQTGIGGEPGQDFNVVIQQAQAGAYTGAAYPGYEDEDPSGPSNGAYGSPDDAPLDPPEHGFLEAQSRDGSLEEIDLSQFRVERSSEFSPGTIFKVMWSEPRGQTPRVPTLATQRVEMTPDFYAGIRRFIVVTSGDGNSSCVPILTYERRACTKNGVNPKTHGIVHEAGHKPKTVRQEPKLGFAPVAVNLIGGESLASQSRVNYAKLQTIEHNVKVRIIGRVIDEHLDEVRYAVDDCWQMRARHASKKHKHRK